MNCSPQDDSLKIFDNWQGWLEIFSSIFRDPRSPKEEIPVLPMSKEYWFFRGNGRKPLQYWVIPCLRDAGVAGSNPVVPTMNSWRSQDVGVEHCILIFLSELSFGFDSPISKPGFGLIFTIKYRVIRLDFLDFSEKNSVGPLLLSAARLRHEKAPFT